MKRSRGRVMNETFLLAAKLSMKNSFRGKVKREKASRGKLRHKKVRTVNTFRCKLRHEKASKLRRNKVFRKK